VSRALGALTLVLLLAGCRGWGPAGRTPAGSPSGGSLPHGGPAASAAGLRVAVVDLPRAAAAHPRWSELAALDQRIAALQAELALPETSQVQAPPVDLGPQMKAEAERAVEALRPEFRRQFDQEAAALQDAARRELTSYADKVRADQQTEFEAERKALEARITKAVQDKDQEITADNAQFQRQVLEQYRLPLLNLRLKQDTVQPTDRQEADRLSAQLVALTKERDDKVAAHEKTNLQTLQDFQRQQTEQYTAALADLRQQYTTDGQRLINAKAAEIDARLRDQIATKQAELNTLFNARLQDELKAREQVLIGAAREQAARSREQAVESARARVRTVDAQLQAAQEERARLLGAIMADLRVEAAALAQARGWDLILTQTVASVDTADVTDDLIARLKR
jgi:hypothetical protein